MADQYAHAPAEDVAPRPTAAVVALCAGGLAASLTQTMLIPIQSELPQLLSTSAANASWVITVTLLTAAVTMPIAGRLGDLFGKQRVLLVSAATLGLGSVICALSDGLVPMLVGRGLQGMAMGFIPVGIAMLREITPPELTTTAVAAMSATLGVGGALGLPLAAWIADSGNWHLMFWIAAGVAAVVLAGVAVFVPHVADAHPGRVDVVGALGLAVGLTTFLIGVTKGNSWGWDAAATWGCLLGGVAVLVAWGRFELGQSEPLVDLRTTARLPVLLTNLAAIAIGFGMMAQAIVVPQLMQLPEATGYGLGQSILAVGLWMAPGGLMMLLFAPVSSRLITGAGAKRTVMIGAALLGTGYLVATVLMDAPWQLLIASTVTSIGVAIGYAAMPTLIMGNVPPHETGAAVGLNSLMRSLGTTLASAVMAAVLTSRTTDFAGLALPSESAFRICFVIGAVAAFVGVAIAATIPSRRPGGEAGAAAEAVARSSQPSVAAGG